MANKPKLGTAARDLALVSRMINRIERGHTVRGAAQIVAKKHPELGLNAASARVRFVEITNMSVPGRGSARSGMLKLFLHSIVSDWTEEQRRDYLADPEVQEAIGDDEELRWIIEGPKKL